jgi:hypothetical protein
VQAEEYPTIDGTTSDIRAPVECGDNNFEAYPAETQMTDEVRKQLSFSLNQLLNKLNTNLVHSCFFSQEEINVLLDMLQDPPDTEVGEKGIEFQLQSVVNFIKY